MSLYYSVADWPHADYRFDCHCDARTIVVSVIGPTVTEEDKKIFQDEAERSSRSSWTAGKGSWSCSNHTHATPDGHSDDTHSINGKSKACSYKTTVY